MRAPPKLPACPDRIDHDGQTEHCQHPVRAANGRGWFLLCCVCGCSKRLELEAPAEQHGPYLEGAA